MFFSKSTNGFYSRKIHGNSIPPDSKEIPKARYKELMQQQSLGMVINGDADGLPVASFLAMSTQEMLEITKKELRAMRAPMLDAVTGIGWEASESGNTALVTEARAIRVALLDITDDPELNEASTLNAMRAAGVAAYRRIAIDASPAFAATFKEITGA